MIALEENGIRKALITQIFIILNVLAFISSYFFSQEYVFFLAQINRNVIEQGEIWRVFTSMFLHDNWFHLTSNMIILYLYGSIIEKNYKKYEYVLIYLVSGLIGNAFSLFLFPLDILSMGASGAIFGLIGAACVLVGRNNYRVFLVLGILYIIYFAIVAFSPEVNVWAHFFGLFGGLAIGFSLKKYNNCNLNNHNNDGVPLV